MKINCLVIDDEPLARDGLANYIHDIDFLVLKGLCESALEANRTLDQERIDLIFLDVQMPRLNGIDFLKSLKHPPLAILTTAYPQYALDGFQLEVLDYLLKPIMFDRFYQSANRAKSYLAMKQPPAHEPPSGGSESTANQYFFVKTDKKYEKIKVKDILFVESMQNYVVISTPEGKYTTLLTLRSVEEELPESAFLRIHKSYLIAINKVHAIEGNQVLVGESWLPVSRNYRQTVMDQLLNANVLKKNR